MDQQEIYLGNWRRILFGNAPPEFSAEVLLRTVFIYVLLLIALRLLGKRMNGQLTITELAVIITLGAIVAVPTQIPDRGLLPAALILVCLLVFQRGISWLSIKSKRIEQATQGRTSTLVKDGLLLLPELRKARISQRQLFAQLRTRNVRHLGQLKRVYLESWGRFSLFKEEEPRPGLSVLPSGDEQARSAQSHAEGRRACLRCGKVEKEPIAAFVCSRCGHYESAPAVA